VGLLTLVTCPLFILGTLAEDLSYCSSFDWPILLEKLIHLQDFHVI
jgi:hypothetical protein